VYKVQATSRIALPIDKHGQCDGQSACCTLVITVKPGTD